VSKPNGRERDKLGRPRHLDDETERRKIMDAAVLVMARNGYGHMAVGDVLAEAQLSTTSFYRHFQSKDALLAAVIRRDGESAQRALQRATAAAAGPVAGLQAWLDGLLDHFYEPRRAARTALFTSPEVLSSLRMNSEVMEEMRSILCQPLVKVLRAGHRAGVLRSTKPEADAVSLFALASTAATSPRGYPRDRNRARAHVLRFAWPALAISGDPACSAQSSQRSRQPRKEHAS
jgi:AcrR family transcriptional regulator